MSDIFFESDINKNIYHKETKELVLKSEEYQAAFELNGHLVVQMKDAKALNAIFSPNGKLIYNTGDKNQEVVLTSTGYGVRDMKEGEGFRPMLQALEADFDQFTYHPYPYQILGKNYLVYDNASKLVYLCKKKNNQILAMGNAYQLFKTPNETYIALKSKENNLWTLYNKAGKKEPEFENVTQIRMDDKGYFVVENGDKLPQTRSNLMEKRLKTVEKGVNFAFVSLIGFAVLGIVFCRSCQEKKAVEKEPSSALKIKENRIKSLPFQGKNQRTLAE